MDESFGPFIAQAASTRTYYELMRLRQLDEWWHWLTATALCALVIGLVAVLYFIDTRQLPRGTRWLLLALRVLAFVGLLIFALDLQKHSEQKLVKNSRFAILVDASQSMGIADQGGETSDTKRTRIAQVVSALAESPMLQQLQEKHDTSVYRFDETNSPTEIATFKQTPTAIDTSPIATPAIDTVLSEIRGFWRAAFVCFAITLIGFAAHLVLGRWVRTTEGESWALLISVFSLIVGGTLIAVCSLRHIGYGPRQAFAGSSAAPEPLPASSTPSFDQPPQPSAEADQRHPAEVNWAELLEPAGGSTRLGDAIDWLVDHERGNPLAGIGVITDGNSNRGIEPQVAAELAGENEVSIYPIAVASAQPPKNIRVIDLAAPARVYPGDEFKLTGYVQAYGLEGKSIDLHLVSRSEDNPNESETLEFDHTARLGADGAVLSVPMQVTPEEVGKRIYSLKVASESIDSDKSDNQISVKVQIVDRQSRVLLLAGGPTREYRFLRNMLYRDRDVAVDVLLQTASERISQEADQILHDLPSQAAGLFEYDAIVAFDPDWSQFDQAQLELIEQWVAEKAGGLVCVAGPVNTALWAEDRRAPAQISVVRQLYPVTFNSSRIQLGRYGSEVAWPLDVTEDGRAVPFLAMDDFEEGIDVWAQFPGVYGYYPVRDTKPAASVYARYSDPQTTIDGQQPPLIVGQFYGSGRVIFLGTGEFWRLRAVDEGHFERFYTKLIRFVSQGRLLRDSNRGLLLVDKDRALRGDAISIRASMMDQQFKPIDAPTATVTVRLPDGSERTIELQRAADIRQGTYTGRFIVSQPGDYQLQLVLPGDSEPVVLQREIRVKIPNLEIEHPQRNDALLQQLADKTEGTYFDQLSAALDVNAGLAETVVSKRRETYLPGTPDLEFQQLLMSWLLTLICGVLFLEWVVRRLNRLA